MESMQLGELLTACSGRFYGADALLYEPVSDVVIDSRLAKSGALYVPIRGERFDGHAFIDAARDNGALCVLSDRPLDAEPYILVSDTLEALQLIAAHYRSRFDIPVIAITGSVGKTSTKEMLDAVLSTRYSVLCTEGSMNNQTGVPLTIFRLDAHHEAAVIELGTNHFGEIDALAKIVSPTVCLLTNIGLAHIEFFGSREGILKGKTEMLPYLRAGGRIIVNGDDDMLVRVENAMRYGTGAACAPRAVGIEDHGLDGMRFTAEYGHVSVPVSVPAPGRHAVYNALAAIAVGLTLGMSLPELAEGVAAYTPPKGRMCVYHTDCFTIIDDSYNANPTSVAAAVDVLDKVDGRCVLILGDMLELGERSDALHAHTGRYAVEHGTDLLLCVGPHARHACLAAIDLLPGHARHFDTVEEVAASLPELLQNGDTVLVKASRGMHLENIVEALRRMN